MEPGLWLRQRQAELHGYASGGVCLGTMPVPRSTAVSAMAQWVDAFFNSSFTHLAGASRLSTHPQGVAGLWIELAGSKKPFPIRHLAEAHQTLHTFVRSCLRTN